MIRNRAGQSIGGHVIDATTGGAFAGVVTVYVKVDAAAQALGSVGGGVCAAEGNGYFTYRPSQAETNGRIVAFTFTGTGAIPTTTHVAPQSSAFAEVPLYRNVAGQTVNAELVDATTGGPFVGAVTVYVTLDAGTQALGGAATSAGNGLFTYAPTRAETNGALAAYTFTGTGAVSVTMQLPTVLATPVASDTSVTARSLITDALIDLGVLEPGDALSAADGALGLRTLNRVVAWLKTQRLSAAFLQREVFPVVANQGTYTIGPGGDFDTSRPQKIDGAAWLQPSTGAATGRLEVPVSVLTDQQWSALSLKEMTNAQWTSLHYAATYAGGLGTVELWPVPNTDLNALVIYRGDLIDAFANLTTFYDLPPGYAEVLLFALEKRLCRVYGKAREWGQLDEDLLGTAVRLAKRQNFQVTEVALDGATGLYDITVGGFIRR